jgi:hypothetical protein
VSFFGFPFTGYPWTVGPETYLVVDIETLKVCPSGPAIAAIWLVTETGAFPATGWSDFAVVILGWWAGALLKTIHSNGVRERIHFMDGPHAVDISVSSGVVHFRLISRDREVGTSEAALNPFISAMTAQSRNVLHACRLQEWWSADADTLESLVGDLEESAEEMKVN